ncbi:hypothetical protein IIO_00178 [Bacillus cereus VD115]|nr:hypothetical protein IIO_00178 [Bacillus cereus VD115]
MSMNQIIEMTVDIQEGTTHSYKEFSQNNLNNSELILNIADGGKEFPLEEKDEIIVYFQKPDKQFVFQDKDIVVLDKAKGKIKVLLTAQTIAVPGVVYGEISIERVEGGVKKRTSTYSFTFRVRPSLASNEVIESTNEFGPLQKGIEVGEKLKDVDFAPIIAAGELAKGAVKKTGDIFTGTMWVDGGFIFRGIGSTFDQRPYNGTTYLKGFRHAVNTTHNFYALAPIDETGLANFSNQLRFDGDTGRLLVKEFATLKDGRVNLTLTADGSNPDTNYPLTATRRGNTVTVSGSVMLNPATSGTTISNVPVDMRPVGNVNMYTPSKSTTAGDVMQVFINATSGALALYGARGKTVDFVMTYVVN